MKKYEQLGLVEPLAGYPAMTSGQIHIAAAYLRSRLQVLTPEYAVRDLFNPDIFLPLQPGLY